MSAGATLNPLATAGAGVLLGVPDDFSPYIKWGALADLLGQDGQARDVARSAYCESRWQEGLQIAKVYNSVEQVTNGTTQLWIKSLEEFDRYNYGWQNTAGTPVQAAMVSWNMLALNPVPNATITLTIDLLRNTPLPSADTDFLQIGREEIDALLDYAEHLALFKSAGAEFQATIPHYKRLVLLAQKNGKRLGAIAKYLDVLRDRSRREEVTFPRKVLDDERAA